MIYCHSHQSFSRMFANACSIARQFTMPIIISHKHASGECKAGIGSFVIINDEGWFVTAYHIIEQIQKMAILNQEYKALTAKRQTILDGPNPNHPINQKELKKLKIDPQAIEDFSIWLGGNNLQLGIFHAIPSVDLAVGQLINFNKTKHNVYPQFKDPVKPMEQGTSLCKLGFPFHAITPTHTPGKGFDLPTGSVPPPSFPIEGIFTRIVNVKTPVPSPYPLQFIETSSPGLRGQSGGPTFDIHGAIWAIQSQTQHLKLGFGSDEKKSKDAEHLKHQYLNVGWGIHSQTITNFLTEKGIKFNLSTH
jgi:hypothetical protein